MSVPIPAGMICSHCFKRPCECPPKPVPLESMIEEMGEAGVVCIEKRSARSGAGWRARYWSDPNAFGTPIEAIAATPREAIESLHAAWRERRNDEG